MTSSSSALHSAVSLLRRGCAECGLEDDASNDLVQHLSSCLRSGEARAAPTLESAALWRWLLLNSAESAEMRALLGGEVAHSTFPSSTLQRLQQQRQRPANPLTRSATVEAAPMQSSALLASLLAPATSDLAATTSKRSHDHGQQDLPSSCEQYPAKRTTAPARIESAPAPTPIRIFSCLHGECRCLVTSTSTLGSLKQQLRDLTGMPPSEQRLLKCLPPSDSGACRYEPLPAGDSSPLSYFRVGRGSELLLVPADGRTFRIFVRTFSGRIIPLDVRGEDTVSDLKLLIQREGVISPGRQRLIFACKQLEDGRTLIDVRITAGDTLHLVQEKSKS